MPPSLLKVSAAGSTSFKVMNDVFGQDSVMAGLLRQDPSRLAQAFLLASRAGGDLHHHWQKLVLSYTTRNLTSTRDIFPAISGLAARYQRGLPSHEYLAGLWRSTLARDLAWGCALLFEGRSNSTGPNVPSWPWASLPLPKTVLFDRPRRSRTSSYYQFNEGKRQVVVRARSTPTRELEEHEYVDVALGATIVRIRISSRMRPLWGPKSTLISSKLIVIPEAPGHFAFANFVDQEIHSVFDYFRGLLVAYEAHRQENIGEIDYFADLGRLADEQLTEVYCLELGENAMLLLEHVALTKNSGNVKSYRRLGISTEFGRDFFAMVKVETVDLV